VTEPLISVLLPVRDETYELAACLASLATQTLPADQFEVIISDASTTGVRGIIALDTSLQIRVVPNPDVIMSRGLNRAAGAAAGRHLAILSAHSSVPTDYLERMLATSQETAAANVGGRVKKIARSAWGLAVAAATASPFAVGDALQHYSTKSGPTDSVFPGFISRSAFDAVGGFNPSLACNEDDEFNARLRAAGYVVWYDASIQITYRPRETVVGVWRQHFRYGRWKVAIARSGVSGYLRLRHLVPSLTVVGFGIIALGAIVRPILTVPGVALGVTYVVLSLSEAHRLSRGGRASLWRTAMIFPVVHSSYGLGFLRGLMDKGYPVEVGPRTGARPVAGMPAQPDPK
jgi:GT2 family glycosyltransferase